MNDAQLMADVLHGLVDVDYTLTISVMKILSASRRDGYDRNEHPQIRCGTRIRHQVSMSAREGAFSDEVPELL